MCGVGKKKVVFLVSLEDADRGSDVRWYVALKGRLCLRQEPLLWFNGELSI
jgi:hypothetical protein